MRVDVLVPQIGEAVAELVLVAWHKRVGDHVKKGDLLFEIDSDKAVVEVDAFVDGVLIEIIVADEGSVMPQQVVAIMETADVPGLVESGGGELGVPASPRDADASNISADIEKRPVAASLDLRRAGAESANARPNISPKARRLAKQADLDWTSISGSGDDGMILVSDVERAIDTRGGRNL